MAEYTDLLKQYMGMLPKPEQLKSLLSPQQTQLQAGLLGAAKSLQPLMGYTTTPTTFGQAAVGALTGAAGGIQEKQQSDLARALQGLDIYSTIASSIPEEKGFESDVFQEISDINLAVEKGFLSKEEGAKRKQAILSKTGNGKLPTEIQKLDIIAERVYGGGDVGFKMAYQDSMSAKQTPKSDWVANKVEEEMMLPGNRSLEPDQKSEKRKNLKDQYSDLYDEYKKLDTGETVSFESQQAIEMPSTKDQMIDGQLYNTSQGVKKWSSELDAFEP